MNKIGLGIIGTGLIWEHVHMPVVDSMPDKYSVVALCARKEENQKKWKRLYPDDRIYGSYEELLNDAGVDVAVVATPIHLNGKVTLEALNAGKDVFEEKPMCLSYGEAEEILKAQD
jgi:predicted dehydrogenase